MKKGGSHMSRFWRLFLSVVLLISIFTSFEPIYANSEMEKTNEITSINTDSAVNPTLENASTTSTINSNQQLQGYALKHPVNVY